MMRIIAVIGNESHTTSSGWARLSVDGARLTHRDATSKEWQSSFKDKHASWCECVFDVREGALIQWEAGTNSGSRGSSRRRQNLLFVVDPQADILRTEDLGYPCQGYLEGRMRLQVDENKIKADTHQLMKESL